MYQSDFWGTGLVLYWTLDPCPHTDLWNSDKKNVKQETACPAAASSYAKTQQGKSLPYASATNSSQRAARPGCFLAATFQPSIFAGE